jgi:hypothetical protein
MQKQIDEIIEPLLLVIEKTPWEDKAFYIEYLAQSYHYVFYSTRMLAKAASNCSKAQQNYYTRCVRHMAEEKAHELLAIHDLKILGINIEDHPENGITRAMWEPQFYKIERQPTSLLGYILGLEYLTVRKYADVYERIKKVHGEKACTFVKTHAEEDPDHVEKAVEQIKALPEIERLEVWKNYIQTCRMFEVFLTECKVTSQKHSHKNHELSLKTLLVS